MRIVIELKRGAAPKKVRNRLFKHTQLQTTFGVNALALVNGEPTTLSLRKALIVYVEHRVEVIDAALRVPVEQGPRTGAYPRRACGLRCNSWMT